MWQCILNVAPVGKVQLAVLRCWIGQRLAGSVGGCGGVQQDHRGVEQQVDQCLFAGGRVVAVQAGQILLQTTDQYQDCLLYTSPSPRDRTRSRMPSSA